MTKKKKWDKGQKVRGGADSKGWEEKRKSKDRS